MSICKISIKALFLLVLASLSASAATTLVIYRNSASPLSDVQRNAESFAMRRFAAIGIPIVWSYGKPPAVSPPDERSIVVTFRQETSPSEFPRALARALPYEGVHITVFYDRIAVVTDPAQRSVVLGHVLVHEITHILQGTARHSHEGLMRASWRPCDYREMFWNGLEFSAEDVQLIHTGLEDWTSRHPAKPASPPEITP